MRLLVHLTTGVENPTKGVLAFLVAATALEEGHDVDVFVAGDGGSNHHVPDTRRIGRIKLLIA